MRSRVVNIEGVSKMKNLIYFWISKDRGTRFLSLWYVMIGVIIFMSLGQGIINNALQVNYNMEVQAQVIDIINKNNDNGKTQKVAVMKYTYAGMQYQSEISEYNKKTVEKGQTCLMYVDSRYPSLCSDVKGHGAGFAFGVFMWLIIMISGVGILVGGFLVMILPRKDTHYIEEQSFSTIILEGMKETLKDFKKIIDTEKKQKGYVLICIAIVILCKFMSAFSGFILESCKASIIEVQAKVTNISKVDSYTMPEVRGDYTIYGERKKDVVLGVYHEGMRIGENVKYYILDETRSDIGIYVLLFLIVATVTFFMFKLLINNLKKDMGKIESISFNANIKRTQKAYYSSEIINAKKVFGEEAIYGEAHEVEEPTAEESTVEEPIAEEPIAEEPTVEEPFEIPAVETAGDFDISLSDDIDDIDSSLPETTDNFETHGNDILVATEEVAETVTDIEKPTINRMEGVCMFDMKKKKISILGDSYSTYKGYNRDGYDIWYPNEQQGVMSVEDTWWKKLCDEKNLELIDNNSYSGSTICNIGYDGADSSNSSFITRITREMSPESTESDYLIIFGGTNDFWAGSPVGQIKYQDFNEDDFKQFAPAFCILMSYVTKKYANSEVYVVINDILPDYMVKIMEEVCEHYGHTIIRLEDVNKINGHPTVAGMTTIAEEISKYIDSADRTTNILCYGDSNTYGHIPITCGRYDSNIRWTGVLKKLLGDSYEVIEEGCNGRTTVFIDPEEPWKSGLSYLRPCLNTHKPVDMVIVMLGSNDLKRVFNATATDIANGMEKIVNEIKEFTVQKQGFIPRIVIVSPPVIGENIGQSQFNTEFDYESIEKSKQLAVHYKIVADRNDCIFVNAADYIKSSEEDSLHLTKEAHGKLAQVLYDIVMSAYK